MIDWKFLLYTIPFAYAVVMMGKTILKKDWEHVGVYLILAAFLLISILSQMKVNKAGFTGLFREF